jgi:hypothetical protein
MKNANILPLFSPLLCFKLNMFAAAKAVNKSHAKVKDQFFSQKRKSRS